LGIKGANGKRSTSTLKGFDGKAVKTYTKPFRKRGPGGSGALKKKGKDLSRRTDAGTTYGKIRGVNEFSPEVNVWTGTLNGVKVRPHARGEKGHVCHQKAPMGEKGFAETEDTSIKYRVRKEGNREQLATNGKPLTGML